jgi:dCMP deaminase
MARSIEGASRPDSGPSLHPRNRDPAWVPLPGDVFRSTSPRGQVLYRTVLAVKGSPRFPTVDVCRGGSPHSGPVKNVCFATWRAYTRHAEFVGNGTHSNPMSPTPSVPEGEVYTSARSLEESLLRAAWHWAQDRSKDPRTKVGAVVYDPKTGASIFGYNGFNRGMPDLKEVWDNRDRSTPNCKYNYVRHAEANALEKAWKLLGDTSECLLVVTHLPCESCMKDWIVPSGIKKVFYCEPHDACALTIGMARQHGIDLIQLTSPGVGEIYSGPLAELYVPPVAVGTDAVTERDEPERHHPPADPAARLLKEPPPAPLPVSPPPRCPLPEAPPRKKVFVDPHAIEALKTRFPDEISGTYADLIKLLVGMYHCGQEVGERVCNTGFVRVAEFRRTGRMIGLSCRDEGHRIIVITVLFVEELHTTGFIRLSKDEEKRFGRQ